MYFPVEEGDEGLNPFDRAIILLLTQQACSAKIQIEMKHQGTTRFATPTAAGNPRQGDIV